MNHNFKHHQDEHEQMENAFGQFFDVPVTFNPFIAKALKSTKAAILADFLIEKENYGEVRMSHGEISVETGLGLTEVKTALQILERFDVISRVKEDMNIYTYTVSPYFINDLFAQLEQQKGINGHLTFDIMSPVSINRLHMQTVKDLGGNVNSSILLSFLLGALSIHDRDVKGDLTEWFESNDTLWQGMTGMTDKELRNAKKTLVDFGLLIRSKQGMPARVCFRLNMKLLADVTWHFAQKQKTRKNHDVRMSRSIPHAPFRAYA